MNSEPPKTWHVFNGKEGKQVVNIIDSMSVSLSLHLLMLN